MTTAPTLAALLPLAGLAACQPPPDQRHHMPLADAERGRQAMERVGCGACHDVPGVWPKGRVGPALGAGILPNNRGTLIGWIANSQAIKPGNRMPAYSTLSADQLRALAVYLESRR